MQENNEILYGFNTPFSAIVYGISGGIGGAIAHQICTDFGPLNTAKTHETGGETGGEWRGYTAYGLTRSPTPSPHPNLTTIQADALNEQDLSVTVQNIRNDIADSQRNAVRLIVVGIGALHRQAQNGAMHPDPQSRSMHPAHTHSQPGTSFGPEKTWRDLSAQNMAEIYAANTIAPALIAKHFLPLLPREGRSVFAVLSARVGSISDNRLGGWYSYRASKAALNQIIKTTSIELARTRPEAICLGLHPGTVDTELSKPFQANVKDGKLFTPQISANHLLNVIGNASTNQSGTVLAWDGTQVPA